MNTEPDKQPDENPDINNEAMADQAAAQTDATPDGDLPAAKIAALQLELVETKEKMMRALADAENTRRRAVKEREDAGKYAVSGFAKDLLDFADNFQRALAAIPQELHGDEKVAGIVTGLQAMEASLMNTFGKNGITRIEPLDEQFNPNFHEVMFEAPVPGKPGGIVIQVVEAGYILNDRLLRAAKVGISKADGGNHQVDQSA